MAFSEPQKGDKSRTNKPAEAHDDSARCFGVRFWRDEASPVVKLGFSHSQEWDRGDHEASTAGGSQ